MIESQYFRCIKDIQENANIKIIDRLTNLEYEAPSTRYLKMEKESLEDEANIILSEKDLACFNLVSVSIGWDSILSLGDIIYIHLMIVKLDYISLRKEEAAFIEKMEHGH